MTLFRPAALARSAVAAALLAGAGCTAGRQQVVQAPAPLPRELDKVSLPDYVIEPPDVLIITATRLVPKPPYKIEAQDTLLIQTRAAPRAEPIDGEYVVEPDGRVTLGRSYGSVAVAGLTADEARQAIEAALKPILNDPATYVAPLRTKQLQPIVGEHLVRPDGTVSLGTYGQVRVVGMTASQAQRAIEAHLTQFLQDPKVSVDVGAFNSKVYYVVFDGAGVGQQVVRLPATGNETVLDAVAQVNGLTAVSNPNKVWVARPAQAGCGVVQTLPVDWKAITTGGVTDTNYQIFPGDRLYVQARPLVTLDNTIARIIAPAERLFGFTLLGSGLVGNLQSFPIQSGALGGGIGNVGGVGGVVR